jgi:thiol:disulfide interchange protein DsbC
MKRHFLSLILATSSIFGAGVAYADSGAAELQKKLTATYPNTKFTSVKESASKGMYEVVMGSNVVYMDDSARYWFFGNMYDMKDRRDLTAQVKDELDEGGKVDVTKMDRSLAIKTVKGNGSRVMYVFSDPNCGYCKMFEKSLASVTDVTIYTYVLPILSEDSLVKAKAIYCSKDKADVYQKWMTAGVQPKTVACKDKIEQVQALASSIGVKATPTLVGEDGRVHAGAMQPSELNNWLTGSQQKVALK